jgi:hypothetical protein
MWSPRAEQIVSRLIANLPSDQLDPERTHAARLAALPIGVSMCADYYLGSNGEVVVVGADFVHPDVDTIHTDFSTVRRVLIWGAKRYPKKSCRFIVLAFWAFVEVPNERKIRELQGRRHRA